MTEFPFHLKIRNAISNKPNEQVTCRSSLRIVPGKREVYDAVWNGQAVIAKVFLSYIKGLYALKKEWRGLMRLQKSGLNGPKPLFWGRTEDGKWAMVIEKIAGSSTAISLFNDSEDKSKKSALLSLICSELVKQHSQGILQKDLHLGNFLVTQGKVFAIDPGQIKFYQAPLSRKRSIAQLAVLACYLPAEDTVSLEKLCKDYFAARGWEFKKADLKILQKETERYKSRGLEKWLKKSLRTSAGYVEIKSDSYNAIFDKTFCTETKASEFVEQIDSLMNKGEILKRGNTCYVSAVIWNGQKIVIKRYNYKHVLLSVYFTIKGSRAKHGWLSGHRLRLLNIETPPPIAYIERRRYGLVQEAYLITRYLDGQKLNDFLESGITGNEEKTIVTQKVIRLLNKLHEKSISHGDLKHLNILVTGNGPVLTDLDAMRVHKFKWFGRYRAARDIEKFIDGARGNYDINNFMEIPAGKTTAK